MATELNPQRDETLPERADIAPDSDPLAALAAHLEDHVNEDDSNGLVLAYRDIAKERGVSQTVVEEHGRLLETVPSDLVVDTYSHVPTAFGGAVLNFGNAIKKSLPGDALSGVAEAGI